MERSSNRQPATVHADQSVRSRIEADGGRFLIVTVALMIGFYTVLYHPYDPTSLPGRCLVAYLELVAGSSAAVLEWLGEPVTVADTTVTGRFPFVVVLDCAALDAQSLFTAAVLAFPASIGAKVIGLVGGLSVIWALNTGRLVVLYFAGASSIELFRWMHEELFVLLIIAAVCGQFFAWTCWARTRDGRQCEHAAKV